MFYIVLKASNARRNDSHTPRLYIHGMLETWIKISNFKFQISNYYCL